MLKLLVVGLALLQSLAFASEENSSIRFDSFINNSAETLNAFSIEGPRDTGCVPDTNALVDPSLPTAWLAYRAGVKPTRLVVFAHGNGHSVGGGFDPYTQVQKGASWLPHMRRELEMASSVAFVATDYRDNFGFPALWGAHDTLSATLQALEKFPSIKTVVLMSVSMGGAVAGTAIVEAKNAGITKADGSPLFDYWVSAEGVAHLTETWQEAKLVADSLGNEFARLAANGIERDTGGEPSACPEAFLRRSPALHAGIMANSGLRAATVVHAVNDGLVPYNQGREMASALATNGVPTQFHTVLRTAWVDQDPGTTLTSYASIGNADLAGHASEAKEDHPVMAIAFGAVREILAGTYNDSVAYFECVFDPGLPENSCTPQ